MAMNFQVFNKKYGKNVLLRKEAKDALSGYSWPGNIRELENLIERLVSPTRPVSSPAPTCLPLSRQRTSLFPPPRPKAAGG
jgi:transcriptional regulator with GAF, ATPase, and Fis domain